MRIRHWAPPRAISTALLLSLAAPAAASGAVAGARGLAATDMRIRDAAGDPLVGLLASSEVGDVQGLVAALPEEADPGRRAVIEVRLAAARLDLPGVRGAMRVVERRRIASRWRAMALAVEAGAAFAADDYALCASDSAKWLALPEGTDPVHARADIVQMATLAERLSHLPPQGSVRSAASSAPTWRDKATLLRTTVTIDGMKQEAVLDTGANLSVLSESTARRLGLTPIDGGSVQSSSRDAVQVRLAVARRLQIAGTTLTNVTFLVLKDSDLQLPLPGGYSIPAIVGFPVLRALGRVSFAEGALTTGGEARGGEAGAPLVASGSDLFAETMINGVAVPLHVDTGASTTSLGPRFAAAHPTILHGLETRVARSAGAGGATEETAYVLRSATVELGGSTVQLPAIDIAPGKDGGTGNFGTLGQDVLRATGGYTVDFRRMRLVLPNRTSHSVPQT